MSISRSSVKQPKSNPADRVLPYQWKKGQSGNPAGRLKGKTMKEYARELLECQTEEERQAFLHGLPKEVIWKMAEGNPHQSSNMDVKIPDSLASLFKNVTQPNTNQGDEGENKE